MGESGDMGEANEPSPPMGENGDIGLIPGIPPPKPIGDNIGDIGEPKLLQGEPPPNDENGELAPLKEEKGLVKLLLPKRGNPPAKPLFPSGETLDCLEPYKPLLVCGSALLLCGSTLLLIVLGIEGLAAPYAGMPPAA